MKRDKRARARYEYPSEISDPVLKKVLENLVSKGLIYVSLKWDGDKWVEFYKPIARAIQEATQKC